MSQAYGGETAFYLSLVPIIALIVLLIVFKRLQPKAGALVDIKTAGGH